MVKTNLLHENVRDDIDSQKEPAEGYQVAETHETIANQGSTRYHDPPRAKR